MAIFWAKILQNRYHSLRISLSWEELFHRYFSHLCPNCHLFSICFIKIWLKVAKVLTFFATSILMDHLCFLKKVAKVSVLQNFQSIIVFVLFQHLVGKMSTFASLDKFLLACPILNQNTSIKTHFFQLKKKSENDHCKMAAIGWKHFLEIWHKWHIFKMFLPKCVKSGKVTKDVKSVSLTIPQQLFLFD